MRFEADCRLARVLYISYDGLTDPLGQSQILPYLERLSREGHEIAIISFEKPRRFKTIGKLVRAQCSAAVLEWIPLKYHKWPPVLSTLFDLARLRSIVSRRQRVQPVEVVHCRSYLTSLVGLWMKGRFNTKFVFDMRGFWADERIEGNIWSMNNPVYRRVYQYFKRKEREFIQHADAVVTLTENAKQELLTWGFDQKPVWVVPTCVDMELFDPYVVSEEHRLALRITLGIEPTDLVVTYLGSWGTWYLTDQMLAFFECVQAQEPRSRFLIVTTDKVVANNERIKVVSATRKEVPGLLAVSDMAVMFIKPTYSKKASSATKLGELLAMGIPVVTNPGWGDIDRYHDLLPECIVYNTAYDFNRLARSTPKAREFCQRYLSLEAGVEMYHTIYKALTNK